MTITAIEFGNLNAKQILHNLQTFMPDSYNNTSVIQKIDNCYTNSYKYLFDRFISSAYNGKFVYIFVSCHWYLYSVSSTAEIVP